MRTHGTLIKWNDDRGFGFIEPALAGTEVFVHISAFPRDGIRPQVGELISYELDLRTDGKRQALRVMRPGSIRYPAPARPRSRSPRRRGLPVNAIAALMVLAIGTWTWLSQRAYSPPAIAPPPALVAESADAGSTFQRTDSSPAIKPQAALITKSADAGATFQRTDSSPTTKPHPALVAESVDAGSTFQCDGRTMCSQMSSCAEATYFIKHCPGTKMDGNHDGVPCQSQWCGADRDSWP